jgi:hypothetical protein
MIHIITAIEFIKISNWGEIPPELRLKLAYSYDSSEETVIGDIVECWPAVY